MAEIPGRDLGPRAPIAKDCADWRIGGLADCGLEHARNLREQWRRTHPSGASGTNVEARPLLGPRSS
eukprot:7711205-Alexandrium_andersonii.AAC.1